MFNKIACVNVVRILNESPVAQLELARLQAVQEILRNAENAAQEAYLGMAEDEKEKSRIADSSNINQSWVIEQQNARAASLREIFKAVERYRCSHELGMIINSEYVVAADQHYDVTEDIISNMANIQVDYGVLPGFTVTKPQASEEGDIAS
jgi:Skp family chaperone for outer membrane proteins